MEASVPPTIEEAELAVEAPLPIEVEVVAPTEGEGLIEGPTEVPSSSWAQELIEDATEVGVTRVVSELGPQACSFAFSFLIDNRAHYQ